MTVQFVSALELATYFNGTTDLAELTGGSPRRTFCSR